MERTITFLLIFLFYFSEIVLTENDRPDLTFLLDYTGGNATCVVGQNAMEAAVFIEDEKTTLDLSSNYIPSSDYIFNEADWLLSENNWGVQESSKQILGPVTDKRWEEFQIFREDRTWPNYNFKSISISVYNSSQKTLLRVQFTNDWFLDIHPSYTFLYMNNNQQGGFEFKNVNQKWIFFTILRDDSKITVLFPFEENNNNDNKISFKANIDLSNEPLKLTKSIKGNELYFKVHYYKFLYSEKKTGVLISPPIKFSGQFCLTMFVALCDTCTMNIIAKINGVEVIRLPISAPENQSGFYKWKKIILKNSTYAKGPAVLHVEKINKDERGFWALDNVRLCSLSEVRVITVNATSRRNLTCRSLVNPTLGVGLLSKNNVYNSLCESAQLGNSCDINCESIFNLQNYCGNKLCTNAGCTCSFGFKGHDCNDACDKEWGKNCSHSCGKCKDDQKCDRFSGECKNGCENKFIGKKCKEELPVLEMAPTVVEQFLTSIRLKISKSFGLERSPKKIHPNKILIQYRLYRSRSNFNWINDSTINFDDNQNEVTITGLEPDTNYEIRAPLITAKGYIYTGKDVPSMTVSTICIEYTEQNLSVELNAKFVEITRDNNSSLCKWEQYYKAYLKTNDSSSELQLLKKSKVYIKPFTDYKIKVINTYTNNMFEKHFKTEPTGPSTVIISNINVTSNTAVLEWKRPKREEGHVSYTVKYKHLGFIACKINNSKETEVQQGPLQLSFIRLTTLRPYSYYKVSIQAENEVNRSTPTIIQLATNASDDFSGAVPINVESVIDKITIEKPICDQIKGPVIYNFNYIYMHNVDINNDVCINKSDNIKDTINYDNVDNYYPPKNLIPYATYVVKIWVKFENGKTHENSVSKTLITKPGAPSEVRNLTVYSKNKTLIWLRWTRPCPTNGEIESYLISYTTNKKTKNSTVVEECKIWRSQLCAVISVRSKQTYKIEVRAKNRNVNEYGPVSKHKTQAQEEESEPPKNVTYMFNGSNKLVLYWEHPDVTNGPLVNFFIHGTVADKKVKNVVPNIDEKYEVIIEKLTYMKEIEVSPATTYNITILPFNSNKGKSVTTVIVTPPPTPKFLSDPKFIKPCSKGICDIEIPGTSDCVNCTIYVIVNNNLEEFNTSPFQNMAFYPNLKNNIENSEILNSFHWIAKIINETNSPTYSLSIGNNSDIMKPVFNKSNYIISVVLINEYKHIYSTKTYLLHGLKDPKNSVNLNYLLFLLLIVLIVILLLFIYREKLKKLISKKNQEQLLDPQDSKPKSNRKSTKFHVPIQFSLSSSRQGENIPMKKLPPKKDSFSQIIEISRLKMHLEDSLEGGRDSCRLSKQHEMVGSGHIKPINIGSMQVNKPRNRYKNLVAYDHSRVKLKHKTSDGSDYINANYIDGYKVKKAYIATQGPKATTVDDFWYMIWQQDVENIVMLANVVEGGKKKCEEYWPPQDQTKSFNEISIENIKTVMSASYTYREFRVIYKENERIINHLHFTSWPDHGVPLYPQSLVPFVQKMLQIPQGKRPIVVHCSAGVGRTGTILLCDIALRMVAYEQKVDFFGIFYELRQQRVNLVDNSAQYILAHLVVYECLFGRDLSIPINVNFEKSVKIILEETTGRPIIDYLNEINWQINIMQEWFDNEEKTKKALCFKDKNRFPSILPGCSQIFLNSARENFEESYINAVSVDCFQCENRFIVTQQPLPNTVRDFWRMVLEHNVKVIISLNEIQRDDPTSCIFWPRKNQTINPVDYMEVTYVKEEYTNLYNLIKVAVTTKTQGEKLIVRLICLKGWPPGDAVPSDCNSILSVRDEMSNMSWNDKSPIIVTCYDGATASGLFVAMSFMIEKIKLEHNCDIVLAVRTVRQSRIQFVQLEEQFQFLLRVALEYFRLFNTYSNFEN